MRPVIRHTYNVVRSIIVSLLVTVVTLYALLYILLCIPSIQQMIKAEGEKELSKFLKTNVQIGELSIKPFNQVVLYDVVIPDQKGGDLIQIDVLGAGLNMKNSIAKAENEISESESVLFSIQTQDAKELEETKIGYEMQLKELRYTKNKEKYEHMSYDACVALIKAVSTINFMIQSLYDEYNNLVSEYFEQINQDQKALSDKYTESAEWLAIKIELYTLLLYLRAD